MPDLKPCPFCGSSSDPEPRVTSELDDPEEFYIWCGMCKCSGPESLTEEAAALAWNSRPMAEPSAALRKALGSYNPPEPEETD